MKPFTIGEENFQYNIKETPKRGISLQVHISDIHFGIIDPKTEYDILYEQFISKIRGLPVDCISIDGISLTDYLHLIQMLHYTLIYSLEIYTIFV